MLVFDTVTTPDRERADAVSSAMLDATLTTDLVHHDPDRVHLRIDAYGLGRAELTRVSTSGMDTTRTGRRTRSDEEPTVALSLGMTRTGVIEQDGAALGYLASNHAEVPVISSLTGFNAFVEGWALYAEQRSTRAGL